MSQTKLEKIAQLKNQQKQLKQQHNEQERKARTKRLCSRGGYLKSRLQVWRKYLLRIRRKNE